MLTERELNECLKEDIENMEDDNSVNELAYYAYKAKLENEESID